MRAVLAVLLLATLLVASPARANIGAIQLNPGELGALRAFPATAVRIDSEELTFRCAEISIGQLRCTFQALYRVRNPANERAVVLAAFFGKRTSDVNIRIDGAPADRPLTAVELAAVDASVPLGDGSDGPDDPLTRHGFTLVAEPGSAHDIVAAGVMLAPPTWFPGERPGAIGSRHPWLSVRRPRRHYTLVYLVAPIRTWAGSPAIHVRLEYPASWNISSDPVLAPTSEGGAQIATGTIAATTDTLRFELEAPGWPVVFGGPSIGLGGSTGAHSAFRGRLAYELAAPSWLHTSVAVEADHHGRVFAIPMLEAAAPMIFAFPSMGLGVGVPFELRPELRAGVRLHVDAFFFGGGVTAAVDIYPKAGAMPGYAEAVFMAELGL